MRPQRRLIQRRFRSFTLGYLVFIAVASAGSAFAAESSSMSSKEVREAYDAQMEALRERDAAAAMLRDKRARRDAQLSTDIMSSEMRGALDRFDQGSYPDTEAGQRQKQRDFLLLQSNWSAVQAEAHKGTVSPEVLSKFSQQHKQSMSERGDIAAKQVDPNLEVDPMPAQAGAKDKPYSDHDGQLRGSVIDEEGNRAPLTAEQAAQTREQFNEDFNRDLREHGLPELDNPSKTLKTDAMANSDDPRVHRASAEHQNRSGGTVYQDPVAKDMELKNGQFDENGKSLAETSSAMEKARYANEQGRMQDIHRRKQERELERGLQLIKDNPDPESAGHKAGLDAIQNSQAQGDYMAKYTDRLNRTSDQAATNASANHGVDTGVSESLDAAVEKLRTDRTVNSTVESITAAGTYENNQENKRNEMAQIFAHDGEYEAAAEIARNADDNTKGRTIEEFRDGASRRKEQELLALGVNEADARHLGRVYGDQEAGKLAEAMRGNSRRDVIDPKHDNFTLNSIHLEDSKPVDTPDLKTRAAGVAMTGLDAAGVIASGAKAVDDYVAGSEAEALADEAQSRFDAINARETLTREEAAQALRENEEVLRQRTVAQRKEDGKKGAVGTAGALAGMVTSEVTETASAVIGVGLDAYDAGVSTATAIAARQREQRFREKAEELRAAGMEHQANKFDAMADRERETFLTEAEKAAGSAGKTTLGVAGAAGAGVAVQTGVGVAAAPAAVVVGTAAGALATGYGGTRAVIENTTAGKTLEGAKDDLLAGMDENVQQAERQALSQHARVQQTYENALLAGRVQFAEGFDEASFLSAMKTAERTGQYGYVRSMFDRVAPPTVEVEQARDTPPSETQPVALSVDDMLAFDPADAENVAPTNPVDPSLPSDPLDFDPATSDNWSIDHELDLLAAEMDAGFEAATSQLEVERRSGDLARTVASLDRSEHREAMRLSTQTIEATSRENQRVAQAGLMAQADAIQREADQYALQQRANSNPARVLERAGADEQPDELLDALFGGGSNERGSAPRESEPREPVPDEPTALTPRDNTQLTAACRESERIAQEMIRLERSARAGNQSDLERFQALARQSQSAITACQNSVAARPASPATSAGSTGSAGYDACDYGVYGVPNTPEEAAACRRRRGN